MKATIVILIALQLSLSLVLAQITFTREWVAGKRSGTRALPTSNLVSVHDDDENCQSLWPAIQHLIEMEKLRLQGPCGSEPRAANFLDKIIKRPKINLFLKSKDDQFEDEASLKNSYRPS